MANNTHARSSVRDPSATFTLHPHNYTPPWGPLSPRWDPTRFHARLAPTEGDSIMSPPLVHAENTVVLLELCWPVHAVCDCVGAAHGAVFCVPCLTLSHPCLHLITHYFDRVLDPLPKGMRRVIRPIPPFTFLLITGSHIGDNFVPFAILGLI